MGSSFFDVVRTRLLALGGKRRVAGTARGERAGCWDGGPEKKPKTIVTTIAGVGVYPLALFGWTRIPPALWCAAKHNGAFGGGWHRRRAQRRQLGRRKPFDQLTRCETPPNRPRCASAVRGVQMCLRQIRRGRISPGKLGPKARQILRGEADRTWACGVDSGGVRRRCTTNVVSSVYQAAVTDGAHQQLGWRNFPGVLVHPNKHRE